MFGFEMPTVVVFVLLFLWFVTERDRQKTKNLSSPQLTTRKKLTVNQNTDTIYQSSLLNAF
jgi:hypothetical protein